MTVKGLCFLLIMLASPAWAAGEGASAAKVEKAQPSAVDAAFCRALVKHVPASDVAYQPGVDVHGKPVVPADLEDGIPPVQLPDEYQIPLSVDLAAFLGMDAASLPASAMKRNDIPLGTLTLRGDQVTFNGQKLTDKQQDNLAVLCLKPSK